MAHVYSSHEHPQPQERRCLFHVPPCGGGPCCQCRAGSSVEIHGPLTRFGCPNERKKLLVANERMSDTLESQDEATVTKRARRIKCRFPAKTATEQITSKMDFLMVISSKKIMSYFSNVAMLNDMALIVSCSSTVIIPKDLTNKISFV